MDGYWIGRLPWMGVAETLIVVGATAMRHRRNGFGVREVAGSGVSPSCRWLSSFPWWLLRDPHVDRARSSMQRLRSSDSRSRADADRAPQTTLLLLIAPSIAIAMLALV